MQYVGRGVRTWGMSRKRKRNQETPLAARAESAPTKAKGPAAIDLIRRLPTTVLVPGVVVTFAALLADLMIADPLPIVDEATLLWGLVQGMRVLGERRRAKKDALEPSRVPPDVVADVMPDDMATVPAR